MVLSRINENVPNELTKDEVRPSLNSNELSRRTPTQEMPAIESQQASLGRRDVSGNFDASRTIASATTVPC